MIVTEYYETRPDGIRTFRTYSDQDFYIMQHPTEAMYEEAIDIEGAPYTYTETDIPIEREEPEPNEE